MRTPRVEGHSPTTSAQSEPAANLKRRRFLLAVSAGSAATAAAAAQAIANPVAPAASPDAPEGKKGYRETQHVRDYYATTRI
jgi:hypothetical protein